MTRTHEMLRTLLIAAALAVGITALVLVVQATRRIAALESGQGELGRMVMSLGGTASGDSPRPVGLPEDWSRGGKLAIRLRERPAALNPLLMGDAGARQVADLVCEKLARRDLDTLEFRPGLAERWEVSPDGLTLTFHLNPLARFSDGQPLTAEDVIFTFDALRDERLGGRTSAALLSRLAGVRATDLLTVEFRFSEPYFLALAAVADRYILPKHVYALADPPQMRDARHKDLLVGSGPFVVDESSFALMSEDVVLKRNETYWDRGRTAALDRVEFRVVESDLRAFQLLKTGGLDVMYLSPEQFREVEADDNFRKYHLVLRYYTPCLGSVCVGWNNRRAPFSDPRVRQALAHLVPRRQMVEDIYLGLARPADVPFWSDGPQYEPQPAATAHDPALSAKLLDEAGWRQEAGAKERRRSGRPFKAVLLAPKHEERMETLADQIAGAAAEAGLDIEVEQLTWPETLKRLEAGDFDGVLLSWTSAVESDPYLLWHSSQAGQGGRNLVGFSDAEADRLTEAIRGTTDPAERGLLCHELGRLLADRQPVTMLLEPETLAAISGRFAGVRRYRLGLLPQEWYIPRKFP